MTRKPGVSFVIAVDGPAASGKGTLARRLAAHYGFAYLDTGELYRKVGLLALERGADPTDADDVIAVMGDLHARHVAEGELRAPGVGEAASQVAALPRVRTALLTFQRDFASDPPGGKGAVLDGRDIGTVVCPDADVKFFVTASAEERARRRHAEFAAKRMGQTYADVLGDIRRRDARDAARATAPMRAAEDAHLLDTTDLSIEAAFQAAKSIVDGALA